MQIPDLVQLAAPLIAGVITRVLDDAIMVRIPGIERELACRQLHTAGEAPLRLFAQDAVLVAVTEPAAGTGVLLGRIGPAHHEVAPDVPDELVLEAASSLTLRCGDGSITLRRDGKVVIKGRNLVSLATETQRIKGGSVAIN